MRGVVSGTTDVVAMLPLGRWLRQGRGAAGPGGRPRACGVASLENAQVVEPRHRRHLARIQTCPGGQRAEDEARLL